MHKPLFLAALAASLCLPAQAQTVDILNHASNATPPLETLMVVSSRNATPLRQLGTAVSVLEEADINALGFQSLPDVLRTLPSVSVSNNGGIGKISSLSVRGEAGYRTMIRVDGVDISDPTGPQVSAQSTHLLNASVTRVELLRGPQGLMYGADAGGVLNITTDRRIEGFNGGVSAEAGRYDSQHYSGYLGGGNERGDFYLSAARAETDGFNSHMADTTGEQDGYENTTLHGRAGVNVGQNLRAELVLRNTEADTEHDQCGFPAIDDCLSTFKQRNGRAALTHTTARTSNTLAYSITDVKQVHYEADAIGYFTEGEISRWELNGSADLSPSHAIAYGLEHRTDEVMDLTRDQQGVYLEYQGNYQERFYFTAGVRHDDNDDFGGTSSYRISAAYLWPVTTGTLKLKSSLGTGFRAPSLSEIDYNRSWGTVTVPLQQEDSRGLDVGVEYFGPNGLHLEAVVFDQRIDNEIFFDMVDYSGYLQDDLRSESRGLELIGQIPVSDKVRIDANYTYMDTEATDGSPRARQPKHSGNLGVLYQPIQRLDLALHWRTVRDRIDGGLPMDNYQVLSGSARYGLTDGAVVYVRGENVLDEDYEEVPSYYTSGAAFYAGIELTF